MEFLDLTLNPNNMFYITEQQHVKFKKTFYDLPYHLKLLIVTPLLEVGSPLTYERIVKALLQHSSKKLKEEYPVQGVRKLSKVAQQADEKYLLDRLYQKEGTHGR